MVEYEPCPWHFTYRKIGKEECIHGRLDKESWPTIKLLVCYYSDIVI